MSYAYIDYKDEDDIMASYSQKELDVRQEYLRMIEGNSTELLYEPKDFRETNPQVLNSVIGPTSSFKDAFITYIKKIGEIFFTVDPYDLIPIAVDLMDHYMNVHKGESLPFDPSSGRSSTDYMDAIRADPGIQPFLASENDEEFPASCTPAAVNTFYGRIHSCVTEKKLGLDRIYQLDVATERYLKPGFKKKARWDDDYDPDEGFEEVCLRLCANADGSPFSPCAAQDYDLNAESFQDFLNDFQHYTDSSPLKPVLLLICRKMKAINLDVMYFCEENGIILCAFPAFSRSLEPLSRRTIPMIKKKFTEVLKARENDERLSVPEPVAQLMSSTALKVQEENVQRVRRDFRECLQLSSCLKLRSDGPEDGVGLEVPTSLSVQGTSRDHTSEATIPKKKKVRSDNNAELNELMFAQVGPLRESDYYY